jgi:hypothetical protein
MYFASIILLLFILPLISIGAEATLSHQALAIMSLIGKWFVFWGAGVRLSVAGIRQVTQPCFTAEKIFGIHDPSSFPLVRELGFANLSMGLLGICSLLRVGWVLPAAIVGGLYYGLAGIGHVFQKNRNAKENIALVSDGFIFLVLLVFVFNTLV